MTQVMAPELAEYRIIVNAVCAGAIAPLASPGWAWSGWNGSTFTKQKAIYTAPKKFDGFKVNALAPGLRATNLNPQAAAAGGDPAEAAAGAIRLALLPDDGPTGQLFSWDGTIVPW